MEMMTLLSILSAICTIVGFLTSKYFKSNYWKVGAVVGILTFACGYAVYYNSEYRRIKNIHRQAIAVEKLYQKYGGHKEFINASLTFLEENKDRYPDAYERAKKIDADRNSGAIFFESDASEEMHGIIKGIAAINDD